MKYLKAGAKILISVLALVLVFSKIELDAVWDLLKSARVGFIALAIVFYLASQLVSAFRLQAYFRRIKVYISDQTNVQLYALGMFYNLLLPGGIGGDGFKVLYLRQRFEIKVKTLVKALLLDRVIGLFAILCWLAILPAFLVQLMPMQQWSGLLLLPIIGLGYLLFYGLFRRFSPVFLLTLSQSVLVQLLQLFAVGLLLRALGMDRDPAAYFFLFLLSSIAAAIPFTVGGAGARELVFLFGARWLSIDPALAVTLSLLFYLITVLVSLSGLYFSFRKEFDWW